jgi:hypothetical protein
MTIEPLGRALEAPSPCRIVALIGKAKGEFYGRELSRTSFR